MGHSAAPNSRSGPLNMAAVRQQGHSAPGAQQAPAPPKTQQHQAHFSRALQRPLPPQASAPSVPLQAQAGSAPKQGLPGGSLPPSVSPQPAASAEPQPGSARKRTKQDVAQHRQGVLAAQDSSDQDPADGRSDKRQKGTAGQDTSALGSAHAPISVTDSDDEDRPLCSFANFNAFQRPTGHAMTGRPGTMPAGSNGFAAAAQVPAGQATHHARASGSNGHLGGQMAAAPGRQPAGAAGMPSGPEDMINACSHQNTSMGTAVKALVLCMNASPHRPGGQHLLPWLFSITMPRKVCRYSSQRHVHTSCRSMRLIDVLPRQLRPSDWRP